jgi:adenylate cyclase
LDPPTSIRVVTSDEEPLGHAVVDPGSSAELVVPVHDRLFIGRECGGIDDRYRLVIEGDETISRNHCELRLEPERARALVMDTSTNGTRLNGTRIERAVPVSIRSGDRLQVGSKTIEFRAAGFSSDSSMDSRGTVRNLTVSEMVMVVGDVVGYSTVAEYADTDALMKAMDVIYGELRNLLLAHRGTLNNYAGDAFFASWDVDHDPNAVQSGVRFAVAAACKVHEVAPRLELRYRDGEPLRFGWAASKGRAAVRLLTGAIVTVLGDSANVAFRIGSLAGRDGRAEVLVTQPIYELTSGRFDYGPPEDLQVKGREGAETVYGVMLAQ